MSRMALLFVLGPDGLDRALEVLKSWRYFERLRKEAPVHYLAESPDGPFWSVTKFDDIVYVEKHPELFSSEPTIVIADPEPEFPLAAGFITMDGPRHASHRKVVQPVSSPRNLKKLEPIVRERVVEILDGLPVGETFDWVDRVSIELTTSMLATLFDFPYEEQRKLTLWSDAATAGPNTGALVGITEDERWMRVHEYYFKAKKTKRVYRLRLLEYQRETEPDPVHDFVLMNIQLPK